MVQHIPQRALVHVAAVQDGNERPVFNAQLALERLRAVDAQPGVPRAFSRAGEKGVVWLAARTLCVTSIPH